MVQTLAKLCDDLRELRDSSASLNRSTLPAPRAEPQTETAWRDTLKNAPSWLDIPQQEQEPSELSPYTPTSRDTPQYEPAPRDTPQYEPTVQDDPEPEPGQREEPTGLYEVDTARFINTHRKYIEDAGVQLRECHDINAFQKICDELEGKGFLSEPFHPEFMDIISANAMLMVGENANGEVVTVQAMRKDDLTGCTLAEFWMKNLRRIHNGEIGEVHCPSAQKITGQVVYHGELWVAEELRKYRLAATLARLAQAIALLRWNPDFIYGFVSSKLAQRGFPLREGYQHISPAGTHWRRSPSNVSGDDWLAWNAREDVRWLVTQPQIFSE